MAGWDSDQRERFGERLRDLCKQRGIGVSASSLDAALRSRGQVIGRHTLRELLNGRRRPKTATVQALLKGLNATPEERAWLLGEPPTSPASYVDFSGLLAHGMNDGRHNENVVYRYIIGRTAADDRCEEHRSTQIGDQALQTVDLGIGSIGAPTFDPANPAALNLRVTAEIAGGAKVPVTVDIAGLHESVHRYFVVLRLAEPVRNAELRWKIAYVWPDLWRSLRQGGDGEASVDFVHRSGTVGRGALRIEAPTDFFGNLSITPLREPRRPVEHFDSQGRSIVQWAETRPETPMHCLVHCSNLQQVTRRTA